MRAFDQEVTHKGGQTGFDPSFDLADTSEGGNERTWLSARGIHSDHLSYPFSRPKRFVAPIATDEG